jgi:hypothetical protein
MELKTLKDIDLNIEDIWDMNKPDAVTALKAEAIKWVKSIRGNRIPDFYPTICKGEAVINFITEFFNLTEADLIELKGGIIDNE